QEKNKELKDAIGLGETVKRRASEISNEYNKYQSEIENSKKIVKRIASGVDERFNWSLIYKYINLCVPQPDPNYPKVALNTTGQFQARKVYVDEDARRAYGLWIEKLKTTTDTDDGDA